MLSLHILVSVWMNMHAIVQDLLPWRATGEDFIAIISQSLLDNSYLIIVKTIWYSCVLCMFCNCTSTRKNMEFSTTVGTIAHR